MKRFGLIGVWCCALMLSLVAVAAAPAPPASPSSVPSAPPSPALPPPGEPGSAERAAAVDAALADGARYAALQLIDAQGMARGDYDLVRGTWHSYEAAWHTGQLIWGLVEVARVSGDDTHLVAARRAGEWWIAQQFPEGHPLAGMLNARHGGPHGDLINFTTLSDGTPGLFTLSRATGDPRYADVARAAGDFTLARMQVPGETLIYNILDPATASVWTDKSPHHPNANPATLTQVARPNIEGFLYLDMYRHSGERRYLDAFLRLADGAVARQHANGFWMDFEPNDPERGKLHPRFNLWYAEALLEAYVETRQRRYLDAALATLRATAALQARDGTLYYDSFIDGRIEQDSLTGSAVAFAGLLWLRASELAQTREFDPAIERSVRWLLVNRFPLSHPDPNLAGAFLETWSKRREHGIELLVRDISTAFALRFLAAYRETRLPPREARDARAMDAAQARQLPVGNVRDRERLTLDGEWQHYLDPYEVAYHKPRGRRRNLTLDSTPIGNELLEYEWDTAPTLDVPGDWNSQRDELRFYEGMLWYRKRFQATPDPERRHVLYFEGANYRTTVWLNGERLGEHEGGFTPFQFDATAALKQGDNSLVVAVENWRRRDRVPSVDFDWHNYGGLTRSVHLLSLPPTVIHDARVWLAGDPAQPRLRARVLLDGPEASGQPVELLVRELGLRLRATTDKEGIAEFDRPAPAFTAWRPGEPKLYAFEIRSPQDRWREAIGLRQIEVRGNAVYLNGQPLYLAGISVHEERLGAEGGRIRSEAEARELLGHARDLGANFVRLAHYPHGEHMLRVADEMGLLVWTEIPVYWDEIGYADPDVYANAQRQMAGMVYRDFNRASVILLSVANETTPGPARNAFLSSLAQWTRRHDPSRLVTAALNKNPEIDRTITVTDPLGRDLDVIAVNQYEGWYGARTPAEIDQVNLRSQWDKPLILSEFGADAPVDFRADRSVRWSADYQAWLYEETLELADRTPNLVGLSPWILKDFRSPRRHHSLHQLYWNRKGLISETGERKPAFDVLKRYYEQRLDAPDAAP
jgi:beta-glucuronidase